MSAQSRAAANRSAIPASRVMISAKYSRPWRQRSSLALCTVASKRSTCSPLVQAFSWSRPKLIRNQLSPYRGFPVTISCAGEPALR